MRTDGPIYMTKIVVAFRNFMNAPKNNSDESCKENRNIFYDFMIFFFENRAG